MDFPNRKPTRLKGYDYSAPGAYFVTLCVKGREELLSKITACTGVFDCPQNKMTTYGDVATKQLIKMSNFYENVVIDKFVVMPNHIHMLIRILANGQSGLAVSVNSIIARFVGTFKRFCNKEYGRNIWQSRFHDHIIRDKEDYKKIWEYIDTNVIRWEKDCFYSTEIDCQN